MNTHSSTQTFERENFSNGTTSLFRAFFYRILATNGEFVSSIAPPTLKIILNFIFGEAHIQASICEPVRLAVSPFSRCSHSYWNTIPCKASSNFQKLILSEYNTSQAWWYQLGTQNEFLFALHQASFFLQFPKLPAFPFLLSFIISMCLVIWTHKIHSTLDTKRAKKDIMRVSRRKKCYWTWCNVHKAERNTLCGNLYKFTRKRDMIDGMNFGELPARDTRKSYALRLHEFKTRELTPMTPKDMCHGNHNRKIYGHWRNSTYCCCGNCSAKTLVPMPCFGCPTSCAIESWLADACHERSRQLLSQHRLCCAHVTTSLVPWPKKTCETQSGPSLHQCFCYPTQCVDPAGRVRKVGPRSKKSNRNTVHSWGGVV